MSTVSILFNNKTSRTYKNVLSVLTENGVTSITRKAYVKGRGLWVIKINDSEIKEYNIYDPSKLTTEQRLAKLPASLRKHIQI